MQYVSILCGAFQVQILVSCLMHVFVSAGRSHHLELTPDKAAVLKTFKDQMMPQLDHDFMKKDIFLVRFLRAKDFNLDEAKTMLTKSIKWRKSNKLDTIHTEDWADMRESYPIYVEGVDKLGQPIFYLNFGKDWDIKAAADKQMLDRVLRWTIKAIDAAMMKVWKNETLGQTASRFSFIDNFKKFDLTKHVCVGSLMQADCLKFYVDFVQSYELNYPEMCDIMFLLNVPVEYDIVLTAIRPFFSKATNDAIKILGEDRVAWETILFKEVDRDQLPEDIGGTRKRHVKSKGGKKYDDQDPFESTFGGRKK